MELDSLHRWSQRAQLFGIVDILQSSRPSEGQPSARDEEASLPQSSAPWAG